MTIPALLPLRVLLVDDEAPARARLRTLLGDCTAPAAQVVGEAADAAQARAWLADGHCDLVLLDIAMPGRNGLALAADLRGGRSDDASGLGGASASAVGVGGDGTARIPPTVVFVTAHTDHALRAFELDAADYLTKPVRRERLQATLLRVAQRLAVQTRGMQVTAAEQSAAAPIAALVGTDDTAVIVIQDRGRVHRVPVADVLYLRAELKYLTLRTAARTHVLAGTLGDFEHRLGTAFLRIHRNALVARRAVRALERTMPANEADDGADGWSVLLVGIDDELPVSRRQLAAVRAALTDSR